MAYEEAKKTITRPSAADLSTHQYKWVKFDSNGKVALAGDGDEAVGILQNKPAAADREAGVTVEGVSKLKCGGTIAAGASVSSDSGGLGVAVGTGDAKLGTALEAGVLNSLIPCLLDKRGTS